MNEVRDLRVLKGKWEKRIKTHLIFEPDSKESIKSCTGYISSFTC